jgi:hypothetical protein
VPNATERIDPFEKLVFRLAGVAEGDKPVVARILEEGAVPADLLRPPPRLAPVVAAMLVRAFRPPFKLRDNELLGKAEEWPIEHASGRY